ncbi:hypothetical protein CORC01_01418 [Colletotrichum orchidophilum]|uniref:5'-3' DNA helicase ZGRF1-like N-terminal domain-containing protein n=1 Tax=Colletotrichum orchidophilum TaxID=1209926 RepID=A0A1G4BPX1_9PEZI|nr:uncharacterized protein CORC01_01418 [Colletotrichum orchidophilum]OHF03365.1 hypothetical protein CORC01_01418 [Colletotrichum orchidophilum]
MPLASRNSNHNSQAGCGLPIAAPVLEHLCLFTHDLKRKQKRWQDGRLRFHTFNKRIMVYDERGNFIGDMHWREDFDFGEGEEFSLERGAVIVQVAECIGSKDQDLTELLDKRAKEVEQRYSRSAATAANQPHPPNRPSVQNPQAQYRQRHLSEVFTTPRGPQGRAVIPTTSPYEDRLTAQQPSSPHDEAQRPAKRRKRDVSPPSKSGYAQNLFGATLNLSSWSASTPVRSQTTQTPKSIAPSGEASHRPVALSRSTNPCRPKSSTLVDLTEDAGVPVSNTTASETCGWEILATSKTSAPAKQVSLGQRPFKRPGTHVHRDKSVKRDVEIIAGPTEKPSPSCRRSDNHLEASKQVDGRKGTKRSQDVIRKVATQKIDPRSNDDALRKAARSHAPTSAKRKVSGIYGHHPENESSSAVPAVPVTEGPSVRNEEAVNAEEPKTRLRIKTREKRGLMVAKNVTAKNKERQPDSLTAGPTRSKGQLRTDVIISETSLATLPVLPVENSRGLLTDGSCMEPMPESKPAEIGVDIAKGHGRPGQLADSLVQLETLDKEAYQSSGESLQPVRTMRTRNSRLRSEPQHDMEEKDTNPGPRLASLGRRTVKSKEIIGSFDRRHLRPTLEISVETVDPQREPPDPAGSRFEANSSPCETSDGVRQASLGPARASRLENPATRGRKAAQKSDASGAAPQPVLPADLDSSYGRNFSRRSNRSEARLGAETDVASGEVEKKLPGFQRANGGPWSKEAYDLMGCTRPG